ncbi:MAG TPA: restriction endonuclease FokI C-terminal domain-containing protein, partial [Defluviitaleaceae bacterium]|nr:restriction endonuclease FokI C-terminal domain-containing protein [Defluviitaleaceae bacterium]
NGSHLGGSRKPDGILYTEGLSKDYGIIVDTKAYKDGYNLPIAQADEMERYIRENIDRNEVVNPNRWWEVFPSKINDYKFLFVSAYFKGNFKEQLERISINTGILGGAISVEHLLLGAEYFKRGILSLEDVRDKFCNTEIEF